MSDSKLVPLPDVTPNPGKRRKPRQAHVDARTRALANEGGRDEGAMEDGAAPPAKASRPQPIDVLRPDAFMLPPRAQLSARSTRFGYLMRVSFLAAVVAPTLIAILFFAFVASDQYATESSFAVRGADANVGGFDVGAMMPFGGGGAAFSDEAADSYIVQEYIQSREMVEALIEEANFLEVYSRPAADGYYRLDPEAPVEDVVDYWQMMSRVDYDTDTGILNMVVRAFRPQDAQAITAKVLEKSETLVNELSLRAREDSLAAARREVEIAEQRFADARTALAGYRGTEREIDPLATAEARATVVGTLEGELASREAELSALRATMSENAPRVQYVRNQIEALQRQIAVERLSVAVSGEGEDAQPALTSRLARFEELGAEREFAERAYVSALSALEAARVDALKQQRYLAVFVSGSAPEKSTYPDALRWTLILVGALLAIWLVFALVAAAVRDQIA